MNAIMRRLLRYLLYTAYFLVCVFLFGLINLPYEEAEDLLARHARVHLNAELEMGESSLSPSGTFSFDSATLTFSPTMEEAEKIALGESALIAWETAVEAAKSEPVEIAAKDEQPEDIASQSEDTEKSEKSTTKTEAAENGAADPNAAVKAKVLTKKEKPKLGERPIVPSPPLPIMLQQFSMSTSPMDLIEDVKDNELFNQRNQIVLATTINDAPLSIEVVRKSNQLNLAFSLSDFDLERFTLLERFIGFPIAGLLTFEINLTVPVDNEQYNLVESEGNITIFLKENAALGPATLKSKMGEVKLPPIAFENMEIDLKVGKRRLAIQEFRLSGKDLELCGTGHVSLNRARPRPNRNARRNATKTTGQTKGKSRAASASTAKIMGNMLTTSRSNLFIRFKFGERYLKLKENSLLRLVIGDRALSKGKDDEGFIGHKTTARLTDLSRPLSWVPSATSPHRNSPNQCGARGATKAKGNKSRARSDRNKDKRKPRRGRSAKPYKPKASTGVKAKPFKPKASKSKTSKPLKMLDPDLEPDTDSGDESEEDEEDETEAQGGESDSGDNEGAGPSADDEDSESDESE